MTDYSKLSDAEVAELVCRKLGWGKPDSGKDITVWLIERLDLPDICRSTFIYNWERPKDHVCAEIACFDWPAPIMMQKVKDWLVEDEINPCIEYVGKHWWVRLVPDEDRPDCWYGPTRNEIEARALYEAFLQVGE